MPKEASPTSYVGILVKATVAFPSSIESFFSSMTLRVQLWCRIPACTESRPPSSAWSQLTGRIEKVTAVLFPCSAVKGRSGNARWIGAAQPHPDDVPRLVHREVGDLDAGAESVVPNDLGRCLDDGARHVGLPPVIDAAEPIALDARQEEGRLTMGTGLGEKPNPAVRRTPRDEILAQETNGCRCLSRHEVVREGERDPAVLSDELPHRSVTLDSSDQLVLFASDHASLLTCPYRSPRCPDTARTRLFRQVTKYNRG